MNSSSNYSSHCKNCFAFTLPIGCLGISFRPTTDRSTDSNSSDTALSTYQEKGSFIVVVVASINVIMSALEKELAAVEKAATAAVNLVQKFADQDPADPTSCWQNPTRMYEQMDQARAAAMEAWKNLEQAKENADKSNNNNQGNVPVIAQEQGDLRAQFMDMVTDAFADVLAEMKDSENVDLDILVDCLQSGIEILSQEDKEFLMDDAEEDTIPPHEERRRELGFQRVETSTA